MAGQLKEPLVAKQNLPEDTSGGNSKKAFRSFGYFICQAHFNYITSLGEFIYDSVQVYKNVKKGKSPPISYQYVIAPGFIGACVGLGLGLTATCPGGLKLLGLSEKWGIDKISDLFKHDFSKVGIHHNSFWDIMKGDAFKNDTYNIFLCLLVIGAFTIAFKALFAEFGVQVHDFQTRKEKGIASGRGLGLAHGFFGKYTSEFTQFFKWLTRCCCCCKDSQPSIAHQNQPSAAVQSSIIDPNPEKSEETEGTNETKGSDKTNESTQTPKDVEAMSEIPPLGEPEYYWEGDKLKVRNTYPNSQNDPDAPNVHEKSIQQEDRSYSRSTSVR